MEVVAKIAGDVEREHGACRVLTNLGHLVARCASRIETRSICPVSV